ncbi:tRNA-specific adenosine deaminase [Candidatus Annandia adelgestsuga]|uniref:tRNA-specific adenosine deaminase n=1 Tax=Candidatus Annandia adelgestsuga TaxID=1302411 RepID=A0A3Q9CMA9_9ENTR|nr:tRNA adenosine(34) deaminase TadA [Candidatus Annandia adelgestsuga]AZP36341.1 tRNA-specific adenosine deaminase [Candidatus Annandia adelgestsuga]
MKIHNFWMKYAILLAKKSFKNKEVPIGSVLIFNNIIIGEGYNCLILSNDPTSHAEIIAIKKGSKYLNNYRMKNSILYSTLEPCIMCTGAIFNSRINKVVFGINNNNIINLTNLTIKFKKNKYINIKKGILFKKCLKLINIFFKKKRKK